MSVVDEHRSVRRLHHDAGDRPMITIWEVTRACALVCQHCRADAQHRRNPRELTTEQGKALLDNIASFGKPFPIVVMTGATPLSVTILLNSSPTGTRKASTWRYPPQ